MMMSWPFITHESRYKPTNSSDEITALGASFFMLNTRLGITATRTGWIMLMRLKVLKIFSYLRVTPPWLTLSWCWQKFSSHFKHEFVIVSCIELHSSWESQCCCLVDAEFRISFHPHMTIHKYFWESIYVLHSYSCQLFEMSVNGSKRLACDGQLGGWSHKRSYWIRRMWTRTISWALTTMKSYS